MNALINRMRNKSTQGRGCCRVVAVGLDKKGDILGISINTPAWNRGFPSAHAEWKLIDRYGKNISKIVLARFGLSGRLLPIKPCGMCRARIESLGIGVRIIGEDEE